MTPLQLPIITLLEAYGTLINCDGDNRRRVYLIETEHAGTLLATIYRREPNDRLYTIYLRFEDPKRAREHLGVGPHRMSNNFNINPYSGKWNIHADTHDHALDTLKARLDLVAHPHATPT